MKIVKYDRGYKIYEEVTFNFLGIITHKVMMIGYLRYMNYNKKYEFEPSSNLRTIDSDTLFNISMELRKLND